MLVASDLVGVRVRCDAIGHPLRGKEGVVRIVDSNETSVFLVVQLDDGQLTDAYKVSLFKVVK